MNRETILHYKDLEKSDQGEYTSRSELKEPKGVL
jgi:hypothetical protein